MIASISTLRVVSSKSAMFFRLLLIGLFVLTAESAAAHEPDHSFIYIRVYENSGIEGHFDVAVDEINEVFGANLGKRPKVEEIMPFIDKIQAYLAQHTTFYSDQGNYPLTFTGDLQMLRATTGSFVQIFFELQEANNVPDKLMISFDAFLNENPSHINMLGIEYNWKSGLINNEAIIALEFTAEDYEKELDLTDRSLWKGFVMMVNQGVWHIWIGIDHILFLLALILPSVVRRVRDENEEKKKILRISRWTPVAKFKPAFIYIIKVVTAFTVAHTITLSLASLNIIILPSRLVESVIALSIGLAAYHNITPIFKGRDWVIAFAFGLFHGFGFASVLGDLGVKGEFLTLTLLGFNLGVEIGQIVIVAIIFPILYFIRKMKIYPKTIIVLSILLIIISLYWFVERAFDIDLPLDEKIMRAGGDLLRWLGLR